MSRDPPYNTGNDFIYPDDYTESLQTYLEYTGQVDAEGKKFSTNTEADGRFHSKWLDMMYPRLYLARNLLRQDGVIFISVDDNEVSNLRRLCNDIFGEENFVACCVWQKRYSRENRGAIGDEIGAAPDALVLDFFAGSGTTAHATLDLNRQDGGSRKFILVQLPEPTGREDFKTIAEITKERVRRVIKKLDDEDAGKLDLDGGKKQDRGFRVFKLAESNLKAWNADTPKDPDQLTEQLELHVDHIRPERTQEDILFEILMKSGYPLTAPVETLTVAEKKVFSVAEGALLVCLEKDLTIELIRALGERKPERVVCLDAGFAGNDQLKGNAAQIFKTLHRAGDDARASSDVTVFRTV